MEQFNVEQIGNLKHLAAVQDELYNKQVVILQDKARQLDPTIAEFVSYEYKFTHPSVKWKSTLGPVLTLQENILYVYTAEKTVVKFDTTAEDPTEMKSNFKEVVKAGGFEDAVNSFNQLDLMLRKYVAELNQSIEQLESEITRYE